MLTTLRQRAGDEKGFTLIELLVVILIIGILAAIALPTFLGQQSKAQDSSAKADTRNAVSQMESCFTDNQTYAGCPNASSPVAGGVVASAYGSFTGVPGLSSYRVTQTSKSGNHYWIDKTNGTYTRGCDNAGTSAGCVNSSW